VWNNFNTALTGHPLRKNIHLKIIPAGLSSGMSFTGTVAQSCPHKILHAAAHLPSIRHQP
jgi:hypothetical protein